MLVEPRLLDRRGFVLLSGVLWLGAAPNACVAPKLANPEERVVDEISRDRFTLGRLARNVRWQACRLTDTGVVAPVENCGIEVGPDSPAFERIATLVAKAQQRLPNDSGSWSLRAAALLELRLRRDKPGNLRHAARLLARASEREPQNAEILNDLAVAELELGVHEQEFGAILRALSAVDGALQRDSSLAAARFNRALILDRLYLAGTAKDAWQRASSKERSRDWNGEIVIRQKDLMSRMADGFSSQRARDSCFVILSRWGASIRRGDSVAATRELALARAVARAATDTGHGADRSALLGLAAVEQLIGSNGSTTRVLAGAHVLYDEGVRLYTRASYEDAAKHLARAAAGFRASKSAMQGWAEFYTAASLVNLGEFERADGVLRVALAVATTDQPALTGKAVWALGVSQVRRGNYDTAIKFYREAFPYIARSRERENAGALAFVLAEALLLEGQAPAGAFEAYRAMRLLSSFRQSSFLSNHLNIVAKYARSIDLPRAALEVMHEALEVAPRVGKADVIAWAHCARALDYLRVGNVDEAQRDLDSAKAWAYRITDGRGRERVVADVDLARVRLLRAHDPVAAQRVAAQVESTYRRVRIEVNIPEALYEGAAAALAAGDVSSARRQLERSIAALDKQGSALRDAQARTTHSETIENVFDLLIALESDAGNAATSLETMERGRLMAWRGSHPDISDVRGLTFLRLEAIRARLPRDVVLIEYALLPHRLLIWTVSRRRWASQQVRVRRDSVAALIQAFGRETEFRPTSNGASARLYDLLIRPVATELPRYRKIVIVPDRELGRLAFAALWDRDNGKFLVESHELRSAPNASFYVHAAARQQPSANISNGYALVVGDPALDSTLARELNPLPGARREASQVALLHRHRVMLVGEQARRDAFLRLASKASLVHFAGHALFNSERPELSYLALAADGDSDRGLLRAREIGELSLTNVQVAVLSACSTLSPRVTRNGSVLGLAYSFLRAGVPATVSTLWDVDDESAVELLVAFHRSLIEGQSVSGALRAAQLQAMRSSLESLRVPRAWAAYTYVGA